MPSGMEDCGLLQALQMRYQGPWVPNCPVCSCRQALQLGDHTRLQFFIFQTKTRGLELARTTVTTCSFTDLGQGKTWYCTVSSVSGYTGAEAPALPPTAPSWVSESPYKDLDKICLKA